MIALRKILTIIPAIASFAALVLAAPALAAEDCQSWVGKAFFADEGGPPLMFEEKRIDGFYLNQHIPPGQKFQITALAKGYNSDDDYIILTSDGRELHIRCHQLIAAMDPSYPSQHLMQSDAEDFAGAKAAMQAKKDATAAQARRKHRAALARQAEVKKKEAEEDKERREYIVQRLARGGVKVGMTELQVLASSWGTPDKKNHTFTLKGETEQWVYGEQFYLYFTNGILTGIQTDSPDDGFFRVAH